MAKFSCLKCGVCCANIRQKIESDDSDFIKANLFGNSPIVQLVSVEDMSLPIWPWEAEILRKKAEELKVKADIKPFRTVFDINKNKSLILSYFIDHDLCPFLKENQCIVYNHRPLVCRQFPIQTIGLEKSPVFAKCPALDNTSFVNKEEINDFFGESYHSAVKNDSIIEWQNEPPCLKRQGIL